MGTDIAAELAELRGRIAALEDALDRVEKSDPTGGSQFVAKTVDGGSYPVSAGGITFLVKPQDVTGAQAEGGAAAFADQTGLVLAVSLGSVLPPPGTEVLVHDVGSAFVFKYAG